MNKLTTNELTKIARRIMIENNFAPAAPQAVIETADSLIAQTANSSADSSIRDLRSLLWSSNRKITNNGLMKNKLTQTNCKICLSRIRQRKWHRTPSVKPLIVPRMIHRN